MNAKTREGPPDDREIVRRLETHAVKHKRSRAAVWFEQGGLAIAEMKSFADLANKGIGDIRRFLRTPAQRSRAIHYYVSSDVEISHTSELGVFLPIVRVRQKTAPYLHEATHVLAPCDHCPLWFSEGFASFVQSYVSEHHGGYDGAVFANCGNAGIDDKAAEWKATPEGVAVLPFVGRYAEPPYLEQDRSNVAAPFYVMSQSFVKYLVENIEREKLLRLLTARDFKARLSSSTGKSVGQWKREWLTHIA